MQNSKTAEFMLFYGCGKSVLSLYVYNLYIEKTTLIWYNVVVNIPHKGEWFLSIAKKLLKTSVFSHLSHRLISTMNCSWIWIWAVFPNTIPKQVVQVTAITLWFALSSLWNVRVSLKFQTCLIFCQITWLSLTTAALTLWLNFRLMLNLLVLSANLITTYFKPLCNHMF